MVIFCEASVSICVGPRRSPAALCVGPPRSLCRVPALSLSASGPGALCLGAGPRCVGGRRSLCRAPALSVSGAGALCVGPRQRSAALCRGGPRRSLVVCVWARRSLALCVEICVGPPALSAFAQLSVSGLALFVSAPALSVSGLSPSLCVGRRSFGGGALCVGPRHRRSPGRQCRARCRVALTCHPSSPSAGPQLPPAPIRATHPVLRAPSSVPRSTHPARRVSFFPARTPNLTVWGNTT